MTVRIQACLDGPSPPDTTVIVDGNTLAHAVRQAVHHLGLGVGQTRSSVEVAKGEWRWDWSGTIIRVLEIPNTEPMFLRVAAHHGTFVARVRGEAKIIDLRGDEHVTVQLSREARAELDRGATACGRDGYIEKLLLEAAEGRSGLVRMATRERARVKRPSPVRLYTDYPFVELGDAPGQPAPVREVERVVSYDGNKYCSVRIDGALLTVKAGYLYPDRPKLGTPPTSASIETVLRFVSRHE